MRDRFLKERDLRVASLDKAKRSEGCTERSLRAEGAATLDLLARERTSLVETVNGGQERRGVRAPGAKRGCADFPLPLEPPACEQIVECVFWAVGGCSDARARLQIADLACCGGLGPNLCKDVTRFSRLAPRQQDVDERHVGVKGLGSGLLLERARRIRLGLCQQAATHGGIRSELSGHRERGQ